MLGSQKFGDASYSCRCPINSVVPRDPAVRYLGGARAPASSMAPAPMVHESAVGGGSSSMLVKQKVIVVLVLALAAAAA